MNVISSIQGGKLMGINGVKVTEIYNVHVNISAFRYVQMLKKTTALSPHKGK